MISLSTLAYLSHSEDPSSLSPFMTEEERTQLTQAEAEIRRLQDQTVSAVHRRSIERVARPNWRTTPAEQVRRIEFNQQVSGHSQLSCFPSLSEFDKLRDWARSVSVEISLIFILQLNVINTF